MNKSATAAKTVTVQSSDSWRNFLRGIKSKASIPVYTNSLYYFMRHLNFYEVKDGVTTYHPEKLLEGTDILLEDQIMGFIDLLKEKGRSRPLIRLRVAAIKLFYKKNRRRSLDWDNIIDNIPRTKKRMDRPYTVEELLKAINMAEPGEKASMLLMLSSGMRVGALPDLKVKNLHPIDKYGIRLKKCTNTI